LECFVRMIGDHPIVRMTSDYLQRPEQMEALVERVIDFDALEKINHDALGVQNNPAAHDEVKSMRAFDDRAHQVGEKESALERPRPVAKPVAHKVFDADLDPNGI